MKRNRYIEWIKVWEIFQTIRAKQGATEEQWKALYEMLNMLWQEERRKDATPEELAAHAAALRSLNQ